MTEPALDDHRDIILLFVAQLLTGSDPMPF